jgi:hypothetical protein
MNTEGPPSGLALLGRRFLVLVSLMFWQGGFLFYAVVVVPVGRSVLHPPSRQSFITLTVTPYLNLAAAVSLVLLALDTLLARDGSGRRRLFRWLCWLGMSVCLGVLLWLHPRMSAHLDADHQVIHDWTGLYPLHKVYLWTSSVQWVLATVSLVLMLGSWRWEDGKR